MSEIPFNWDDLRLFLAVARHGGLAGAATETEKSAPTLGRKILALERQLGKDLFERSSRGYKLTDDGQTLFSMAVEIEDRIQPIASLNADTARPSVKVSAGTWVTHHLCQYVNDLTAQQLRVQFIAANQALNIAHREAAIGIRNERPTQTHLAAQPLNQIQFSTYATNPDIKTWIRVVGTTPSAQWVQHHIGNSYSLEVTDPRNALDIILAGTARGVLPTFIGDNQSQLTRVSETIDDLQHQQWLVTHHDDRHREDVRQVIDWVRDVLGSAEILR